MRFTFKQFTICQSQCSQKVSTDACIFGAWITERMGNPSKVLDIGAGTGLLMLMIAQRSKAMIDGIEIEENCFEELTKNIALANFTLNIQALKGDVKKISFTKEYDLIVSNPPFYENQLTAAKENKNMAWHSSKLSLKELITSVKGALSAAGNFGVIIPFERKQEIILLANTIGLQLNEEAWVRHSQNHHFTRALLLFSYSQQKIKTEIINIKESSGAYSERMIELMDDYYLNIRG